MEMFGLNIEHRGNIMNCDTCLSNMCSSKNLTDSKSRELPKVIGGFLNLTQKCNLKCKYCFVVQQPKEMTYEVAKDTVDFFYKNAKEVNDTPSINFFGGEPMLKYEEIIVPLTKYIRKEYGEDYEIGITTNGTLLNKEVLDFFKEHNIGFLFSIDGDKKTQDKNRSFHNGKGSFDKIKDIIPLVLEYQPMSTFRATIDHDNVYDISDNFKFAIEMGYTNVFMIVNVFTKWNEEEKEELKKQIKMLADIYMDQIRKGKKVDFNPFNDMFGRIKRIDNAEELNLFRNQSINHIGFGRCGIGATKFASVGMSGNLYSCQELVENPELGDKFLIGNIYTGVDNEKRMDIINQFDPRNVIRSDNKPCKGCLMNKICDGACLINNYLANGDLNIMPEILCLYYQILLDEALRIIKVMADEKNEFFKDIFTRS